MSIEDYKNTYDRYVLEEKLMLEDNSFRKYDYDKPNMAILFDTSKALEEVSKVMSYGANKYSRMNWSKVDDRERYISASLRHLSAWSNGEKIDPESHLNHLAHSITSLLFILELEQNKTKEKQWNGF